MFPPNDGPPVPPIERPAPDLTDLDRRKDHEAILSRFHPELRMILSRVPVERVPSIPPYDYLGRQVNPVATYDEAPSPRIKIREDVDYAGYLLHELLHGAHQQYEPFVQDRRRGYSGLWAALMDAYGGRVPDQLAQDPPHAFTYAAEQSLTNAPNVPLDLYRYFLPLRQGVLTD